ncbi:hypothetical protein [Kineococcus sp. SYSU DK005]|uniref:hypothetical protein n=1 Tax=Kineococcus sp. SYSU DK005 TaxID=3383126 RepID=UPI003D7D6DFF
MDAQEQFGRPEAGVGAGVFFPLFGPGTVLFDTDADTRRGPGWLLGCVLAPCGTAPIALAIQPMRAGSKYPHRVPAHRTGSARSTPRLLLLRRQSAPCVWRSTARKPVLPWRQGRGGRK